MTGPAIEYYEHNSRLEGVLNSIERCGDYFAEGRLEKSPPHMSVESVGTIAWPILLPQVQSLIEVAERAPYGRGEETILDRSVRDCWQIGANSVQFQGSRWDRTLASILMCVADELGLPQRGISAQFYKLLVYETGGFFSSHRDTEKVDGMVATLVISLPVEGEGGELVVRHKDRETVIDMCVADPGEMAYAAFYADCVHSTKPVRIGHRASLVYNLVVEPGARSIPATSPDNFPQSREAAQILSTWAGTEERPRKLVWLLEHDYSEAGLGAESLKGIDASIARTLAWAARSSDCALHLAILRIEEEGFPDYEILYQWGGEPDESAPIEEVEWGTYTLCGWVDCLGTASANLPAIPLNEGEALPSGALDDVEPDEQYLLEATGNSGVSMERSYRRAALVIWPESEAVPVIAQGSIEGAVDYAVRTIEGVDASTARSALGSRLATQLLDVWPAADPYLAPKRFMEATGDNMARMLRILSEVGDNRQTARFLENVVTKQYHRDLNNLLVPALGTLGPAGLQSFLPQFVASNASANTGGVFNLLIRLDEAREQSGVGARRDLLRAGAVAAFEALPLALEEPKKIPYSQWRQKPRTLGSSGIRDLFLAADRFNLRAEADRASELIVRRPRQVDPHRTLPMALRELRDSAKPLSDSPALVSLWEYSSERLLARSRTPAPGPEDKSIEASIECDCQHCRRIATFCRDRIATQLRYPVRQEIRMHLRDQIRHANVDLECETLRRGRPYSLVCSKTPAGFQKRTARYAGDLESMEMLVNAVPSVRRANIPQTLEKLRIAIALSG